MGSYNNGIIRESGGAIVRNNGHCISVSRVESDLVELCWPLANYGRGLLPNSSPTQQLSASDLIIVSIPNLAEWFDPAFGIVEDMNGVSAWSTREIAGESLTLYQPTQVNRPTTSAGLMSLDGSQWMSGVVPLTSGPFTAFIVVDFKEKTGIGPDVVFDITNTAQNEGWRIQGQTFLGITSIGAGFNGSGIVSPIEAVPTSKLILRLTEEVTERTLAVNGSGLGSVVGPYNPAFAPDKFYLGTNSFSTTSNVLSADVGDFIIYSRALTTLENTQVENALSVKYNIPLY